MLLNWPKLNVSFKTEAIFLVVGLIVVAEAVVELVVVVLVLSEVVSVVKVGEELV